MENSEIIQLSSLAKVFPEKIFGSTIDKASVAKGQSFSYQIAIKGEAEYSVYIKSNIQMNLELSRVGCVYAATPAYENCRDDDYLTKEKGLYPDFLEPIENNKIVINDDKYTSVWVSMTIPDQIEAGCYEILTEIYRNGEMVAQKQLALTVFDVTLPQQKTIFTHI